MFPLVTMSGKGVAFAGSSEHFQNKDHPDMVG